MRALGVGLVGAALALVAMLAPTVAASGFGGYGHGGSPVFIMTNAANGNEIVIYERDAGGTLSWVGNVSAGGAGSGGSLADQGSLAVTSDARWLLAVDAGSDQVSVFGILDHHGVPGLQLTDVAGSGGVLPVSVTTFGPLVYVLNDGNATTPGNIAGFYVTWWGQLVPIAGSVEPLSTPNGTQAAQISFSPDGQQLVVSEKATNVLDVYSVGFGGVAGAPVEHPSQGATPYGFAFTPRGTLIVSEAATGSLSSYRTGPFGQWQVLSSSVPDYQGAPCWVAVADGGTVAYTSNAHTNSISSYSVAHDGTIALQSEIAASTDSTPTDLAVSGDGQYLYVYDAGAHEVQGFQLGFGGSLSLVTTVGGLPASAEGLAAL